MARIAAVIYGRDVRRLLSAGRLSGVDITVIALWLGHEDTATAHQYVESDLAMKEAALRRVADPAPQPLRFTATDRLLDFLEAL